MIKHNQHGAVSGLGISLVMSIVLLISALAFGMWAYTSRQDYKDNSDKKVAAAVEKAQTEQRQKLNEEYEEKEKNPLEIYKGPEAYGAMHVEYPKTWSGYIDDTGGGYPVDGYFAPAIVPATTNPNAAYALRVRVNNQPYAQMLEQFQGLQKNGKVTISAYTLPKLPNVIGVMLSGQIEQDKTVTMVILPLRSQTIQIWTEGSQHVADFNNIILPKFTFSP